MRQISKEINDWNSEWFNWHGGEQHYLSERYCIEAFLIT